MFNSLIGLVKSVINRCDSLSNLSVVGFKELSPCSDVVQSLHPIHSFLHPGWARQNPWFCVSTIILVAVTASGFGPLG